MTSCPIPAPAAPERSAKPCSIHVPLMEHETATADFATWPQVVQNLHVRELERWAKRNPDLDIVDKTHAFDYQNRITVTEFFHSAKVPA